jgi:uncharacterized membrane protein
VSAATDVLPRPSLAVRGGPVERPSGEGLRRRVSGVAAVPLLVILGFVVLAAVAVLADQTATVPALNAARDAVGHVIGPKAATATLQAVATGLVTVTSITFSVLLLAVQQTASNLSPVVFDQFLQRKGNQAFIGFFVGLALFAYLVMAAVKDKTPPILGAAIATVLTLVALLILLGLVFTTIDQMRPTSVIRAIHDRALRARETEVELVRRTRRHTASPHPVHASYRAQGTGYLMEICLDRLAEVLGDTDAEIVLHVTVGDHVHFGQVIAEVRDGEPEVARSIADRLAAGLRLSKHRDLAGDPTTGVDELGNIAWTSGSTSKQNPQVAQEALAAMRDLAMRWLLDDPVERHDDAAGSPLPIVYRDNDLERILDVLYDMLVVSHESHQHMLAAAVLDAYRTLLTAADGDVRARLLSDVRAAETLLDRDPPSPRLAAARRSLGEAVRRGPDDDRRPDGGERRGVGTGRRGAP